MKQTTMTTRMHYEPEWKPLGMLYTTIYEHSEKISALELPDEDLLVSSSHDGTICFFNIEQIDKELMTKSQFKLMAQKDLKFIPGESLDQGTKKLMKVNCLKAMKNSNCLVYGTEEGVVDCFKVSFSFSFRIKVKPK